MDTKVEDMSKSYLSQIFIKFSNYRLIIVSFFISSAIFYFIRYLENHIYRVFDTTNYLVFHTIVEFASIVMYISSFLIIYYVGERDTRLRMKVLAGVLLFVGCVDFWHTFSYNGMPGLFIPSSSQTATAFWIVGRLGFAGGILISSFISLRVKVRFVNRWIIAALPLVLSVFCLVYVSYFPFPTLFIEGEGLTNTKHLFEYLIILMLVASFVNFCIEYKKEKSSILSLFISALIISIFSELAFLSYASVYDTYNLLGHIYKLIAAYMIFKVLFIFNINYPYGRLDRAEKEISMYANNLEQLVDQRTEEVNIANQQLLSDLEYAKTIQKAIMPIKHEKYENLEVYSEYIPYEKIGGDYYGFKDLNDEYLAFYIGDVAGHGVPAAMMTIFIKQTIITEKIYQSGIKEIYSPKEVMTNLYNEYNQTDFPLEMYAVMVYGLYNKKTNSMIYSSAGLNTYPLLYEGNGKVRALEHTGFPICKFDKNYQPEFNDYFVEMNKGNKVLFYTDGIVEVTNIKGDSFGENKLMEILSENGHMSPKEISKEILNELNKFTEGVKLNDDVHYFIMQVN
ncbi:SpoIIE family protein phosphatase [Alkalibaculum sp. M08DMB]|uniref:SpoIIE family protein phosphatase n=1 Tax=Alkalibaculum sporogenes TaxID=2655001 RepID=A0A6A7K4U8_9FIRM|nr:MASE3 domain-containing protein [Alkalibaculum sporogenes]MPW24401.1 SpoIIE family protein phosphatase [Alkalibaculum sporogenes]